MTAPRPSVVTPAHGPRGALARLARFAVSGAAVVTSVTGVAGVAGVAGASPVVRPPAAMVVVGQAAASASDPAPSMAVPAQEAATTVVARHRDTPYALAARSVAADQVDATRDEVLALNLGRPLPDGTAYRGGSFPAGWEVVMPAAVMAATQAAIAAPAQAEVAPSDGHVVADGESYWSISEAHLPGELGREPTPQEVLERTQAAIAYNAPILGYDDPAMLHTDDVVHVDAVMLSVTTPVSAPAAGGGHVVGDGESYWSISEAQLPGELGREPTGREIYERTEAAIAYNAPLLGYDDPNMLHPGDVVYVDAATLAIAAQPAATDVPAEAAPAAPAVAETAPTVEATPTGPAAATAAPSTPVTPTPPVDDGAEVLASTATVTPASEDASRAATGDGRSASRRAGHVRRARGHAQFPVAVRRRRLHQPRTRRRVADGQADAAASPPLAGPALSA